MSPGLLMIILSNLGWLGAVIIPLLTFISSTAKAILIPIFIIGGQLLWYGGLLLLGKQSAARFLAKINLRRIFKRRALARQRQSADLK